MDIKCTLGDVIGKVKETYLKSGEKAVYADEEILNALHYYLEYDSFMEF